jgi:hypothetical protein
LPSALARLQHAPEIPVGLDQQWIRLLTAMTATEPAARPSAREVAMALDEITLLGKGHHTADASILALDEVARMEAVHRYPILDTPADGAFDRPQGDPGLCASAILQAQPWIIREARAAAPHAV